MPVYKQKLRSGKIRFFVKGQHKGVAYWQTVQSEEEGERYEAQIKQGTQLKRERPRGIKLASYIESDYLPLVKRIKPSSYAIEKIICNAALIPFFKDLTLSEIDPRTVRAWQAWRQDGKTIRKTRRRANATVNREQAILSQIFKLAMDDELIDRNPCARVRRLMSEPHRVVFLTEKEEAALLAACTGRLEYLRDMIVIALNTGLRPGKSELLGLRLENCDFRESQIILTHHKTAIRTQKIRIVPMNSRVRNALLRLATGKQPGAYLFTQTPNGKPYHEIARAFRSAATRAKLPEAKRIPYVCRHTFGTRLAQAGVGIPEIKELMGHSDIKMTLRYIHSTISQQREAVERIVAKS